jgi:hypothetical protein
VLSPFYLITRSFLAKTLAGLLIEGQIHLGEAGLSGHGLNSTPYGGSYEKGHLFEDLIGFWAPVHGLARKAMKGFECQHIDAGRNLIPAGHLAQSNTYLIRPTQHCLGNINIKIWVNIS